MNSLDSDPGAILPQLILILVLTGINAFFASAEMAIVSTNKSKIKQMSEEGNQKAKLLLKLIEDPSNFLSTIQIGITLAGFFSSASAATGLSSTLASLLAHLNIPYLQELSMIIVTLLLSYFTLVFGELVPKRIALKKAENVALKVVKPVYVISIITKPFIKILSLSSAVVLKITGQDDDDIEEKVSEEEIKSLIMQSQEDGCIEDEEKEMIYGVFEFNDRAVKEIMTSRRDTFMVDINDDLSEIIDEVINSNHSRIPVYRESVDDIVGILYVRDILLEARKIGFENISIENILHKPYFVPETNKANELFKTLKEKKNHMALLFDEYGGFSGIVTMEDLIEEIVGEIEDEYDEDEPVIVKLDENNFMVKGYLSISDFNDEFDIELETGEYDTLNGYLINTLGEIPDKNIELKIGEIIFTVSNIESRRIEDVKVSFLPKAV